MQKNRIIKASSLVLLAAVAGAVALGGSPTPSGAGEPPARKLSALDRAAVAISPPAAVAQWAVQAGKRFKLVGGVKHLRSNLGSTRGNVYAFRNVEGGVCYLYVGYAGACSKATHVRRTGAQWTIGAGVFVAVVTDDVESVDLSIDGTSYRASIANNVAFTEFPNDATEAVIHIAYAGGETQDSTVRLRPPGTPAPSPDSSHP